MDSVLTAVGERWAWTRRADSQGRRGLCFRRATLLVGAPLSRESRKDCVVVDRFASS